MQYRFKGHEPPFEHQKATFHALIKNPAFLVANEPGTGKTRSLVCAAEARHMAGLSRRGLYVCPKGIRYAMAEQIKTWTDLSCVVLDGSTPERAKQLVDTDAHLYIVNYRSLVLLEKQLEKKRFDLFIFDESTRLKHTGSQVHKAAYRLSKGSKVRWLATGTPLPRDPLDLFGQYSIVDKRIFGTSNFFRDQYLEYGLVAGHGMIPQIVGYKNQDELKERVAKHSIRFLKSECLDLPDKLFVPCKIALAQKQQALYDELVEQEYASLPSGNTLSVESALSRFMRFQQVSSGFVGRGNDCEWLGDNAKLDYLLDLLDTLQLHDNKVIIWCSYVPSIEMLQRELAAYNPAMFYGGVKDQSVEIDKFNKDSTCRVLIGNSKVGIGATMNVAKYTVYYELPYFDTEAMAQSQDRNHRIGQRNNVTYYILMADGTVDHTIWRNLQGKFKFSRYILGDDVKEILKGTV